MSVAGERGGGPSAGIFCVHSPGRGEAAEAAGRDCGSEVEGPAEQ